MGTWGPGVFQNDAALDLIGDIDEQLIGEMRCIDKDDFDISDLGIVVAAATLLSVHYENFGGGIPDDVDVRKWGRRCLELYDRDIDQWTDREDYKARRRAVVLETFRKLEAVQGQRPRMDL